MDTKNKLFQENFIAPVQKAGRNTLLMASVCLFLPGLYLYFFHGLIPPFDVIMRSIIAVWSFMVVMAVIEPIVYYPILGLGGTYMSFLVGNVLNLRVPVSATVQQVVGTSEGSPEAEIVSTLGIAGSLFASITVMVAGILAFLPLLGKIQGSGSAVGVGLDQVLPALFGALGGIFLFRVPKLGIVPLILGLGIALFKKDLSYSIVIPPMVIISILSARIMYKKKWVKGEGMM
jgi:hypothetical protein